MKKIIIFSMFILQFAAGQLHAQTASQSPLETKLALENSLEKRLTLILSEALGTEDIIVIISADMQEQGKKAAFEIMPGIPEKEKMGEMSLSSSLTMVKKISANIILDKSVTEEDTKLAVKLAAGLLGLPPERQDLISVEKMNFRKAHPMTAADLLAPANIWSLAWITLVAVLVMVMILFFLAPLSKSAKAFVDAFNARNTAVAAENRQDKQAEVLEKGQAEPARETASAQAASTDGRKPPFWFLNASNTANLAFIMQSRTVDDLTIVLSYAPGELASKLAEALYPRSVEALAALPTVRLMPEARVRALEAELLAALDYVVGGEDKALAILSGLDESVQEKALDAFGRLDPALSRKFNASVVKLADLRDLEPAQAQAIARRLPMRVLAAALKGSTYVDSFMAKLSSGMQERFKQELELTRIVPGGYKPERAKVVEALRQMIKEGFITAKNPLAPQEKPPLEVLRQMVKDGVISPTAAAPAAAAARPMASAAAAPASAAKPPPPAPAPASPAPAAPKPAPPPAPLP